MKMTVPAKEMKRHAITVGVFIPADAQLLDAATIDVIGSMGYEYLSKMERMLPKALLDLAPSIDIRYIGTTAGSTHDNKANDGNKDNKGTTIELTSNMHIATTHHFSDPSVAPGQLDIILVPGPDPNGPFDGTEEMREAMRWLGRHGSHSNDDDDDDGVKTGNKKKTADILSVCTGVFVCGEAGLLKGRKVCGPRGLQREIRAKGFGERELVGEKVRWERDGRFWSSGGVTNGNDLVAAYCRASPHHFPAPLVEFVCGMLDVGDRAQVYDKGQSLFVIGIVYQLFRAWLMGLGRKR
ncbi:hypothetical protein F4778DRAFT_736655 [Xylariomycetidae sp. FL2044]|nr:hypothetical protein F4778DRAFT_736655 [Xylariomycetidae sp. FL2044]